MKALYSLAGAVIIFVMFFGEKWPIIGLVVAVLVLSLLYLAEWLRNRELNRVYPGRKRGK